MTHRQDQHSFFHRDGAKKQAKQTKWCDSRAQTCGQLKVSKQAVTQVSAAYLWQSQLGCMLMKAHGLSAAERVAKTMNHLLLILYHQVVSEGLLSR